MSKIIRLYRHGETEWNKLGWLQGWLDSPLTDEGILQAKAVSWDCDYVISSDLGRAVETARLMFPHLDVQVDERLREIDLGDWQGQAVCDLSHNVDYNRYLHMPEQFQGSSQESFEALVERMHAVLDELEKLPHQNIAVVSHGVAIASVIAYLREQSFQNIWSYMPVNGQYMELKMKEHALQS